MSEGRRSLSLPIMVILGGIFLLAAALLLVWQNKPNSPLAGSQTANLDVPFPEIDRVSPANAKIAFDSGTAVFVDVRDAGSYADRHVSGALNIPLDELPDRLGELDPADWIITYCT